MFKKRMDLHHESTERNLRWFGDCRNSITPLVFDQMYKGIVAENIAKKVWG